MREAFLFSIGIVCGLWIGVLLCDWMFAESRKALRDAEALHDETLALFRRPTTRTPEADHP